MKGKRSTILFWAGRVQLQLHAHKTPLFAVIEEWTGLFPTPEDVSTVPLHDWPESRDPRVERDFPPQPSSCHRSSENHPRMASADKKTGVSCWYEQQHWLFPAQKSICPISHLRNKEAEKSWFSWPRVRPRTHLNWQRACTVCSHDSRLSPQGNTPAQSILTASARSCSLSVPETADFLPNELW